jgi:ATP-dependent DNA helicase UvrD/PcrA
VFLRHVALVKEREQARDKEAEAKVASLSLTPGDSVEHDKFGQGIVQSVSGSGAKTEAMIDFGKELGVKRLVLGYAPPKKL